MLILKSLTFLTIVFMVMGGFAHCAGAQVEKDIEVEVIVGRIGMNDFDLKGAVLSVYFDIINSNDLPLIITRYDYSLNFNEEHTKIFSEDVNIPIEDGSHKLIFDHIVNFEDLSSKISNFTDLKELNLTISGSIHLSLENGDDGDKKVVSFSSLQSMPIAILPDIKGGNLNVKALDYGFALLEFEIIINNSNPFPVTYTPSYAIMVAGLSVAEVSNARKITAGAGMISSHFVERRVRLLSLSESILRRGDVEVLLVAVLDYSTNRGSLRQNVSVEGVFDPPALPRMVAKDVAIRVRGEIANLNIIMEIDNPNDFEVVIKNWDFKVLLNRVTIVDSYTANPLVLKNKKNNISIPIVLRVEDLKESGISGDYFIQVKVIFESLIGGEDTEVNYEMGFF